MTETQVAKVEPRDPWDHWRRRVAGERVAVFEEDPQWGFYRWQQRIDYPVAIFERDDELVAFVGSVDNGRFHDPKKLWDWLNVIDEETYNAVARDGKSFVSACVGHSTRYQKAAPAPTNGRAWREAKTRIIEAAASGKGVRLTAQEAAEAAAEFGSE